MLNLPPDSCITLCIATAEAPVGFFRGLIKDQVLIEEYKLQPWSDTMPISLMNSFLSVWFKSI